MAHTPVTGPFKPGTPHSAHLQNVVDRGLLGGPGERRLMGPSFEDDVRSRASDEGLIAAYAHYSGRAETIRAEMIERGIDPTAAG